MKPNFTVPENLDASGARATVSVLAFTAMAAFVLAPGAAWAAGGGGKAGPSTAVKFEAIPGSKVKRVILTAKAVERLGIELGKISEKKIIRKQMFGGQVTHPLKIQAEQRSARSSFGGFARPVAKAAATAAPKTLPKAGETWVRLTLTHEEWDRVNKDSLARIMPLATRPSLAKEVFAKPSKLQPLLDVKRSMLAVYFEVQGKKHGMKVNDRMRVQLTLKGDTKPRKVVPYSAVYYDGKGKPWVYTTSKPRVYERKRVSVERIVRNNAVLTSGPPLGTKVVTVGSSLLFGAEVIYKR